jgi:2-keto-4-pentenoate hydratase/2-oxohepta-3-ene-1,7-dioic acid hydratase in catechol pathway
VHIARFATDDDIRFGILIGPWAEATELAVISGDPLYTPVKPTGERIPLDDVRLLAPVIPRSKVVGVGRNYAEHAAELGNEVPTEPLVFLKPNTSVIGPLDPIQLPRQSSEVHFEGELAVVIGRICRDVPRERAGEVVFGYTIANDVTARDFQKKDGQWWRAKGFDTFCPLGPYLVTDLDPSDRRLTTRRDGKVMQNAMTSDMVFDVPSLVSFISTAMTLLPGDIILTGTPQGVGPIVEGQRVEVEIEGMGILSNPVINRR